MNAVSETKSAGVKFMDMHEQLCKDFEAEQAAHHKTSADLSELLNRYELLEDANKITQAERNEFLQYAVELAAQLQFVIAGSVRALQLAARVKAAVSAKAGVETPISDEQMDHLQKVLAEIAPEQPEFQEPPQQPSLAVRSLAEMAQAV